MYIKDGSIIATAEDNSNMDEPKMVVPALMAELRKRKIDVEHLLSYGEDGQLISELAEKLSRSLPRTANQLLEVFKLKGEYPIVYSDSEPMFTVPSSRVVKNLSMLMLLIGRPNAHMQYKLAVEYEGLQAQL